MGTYRVRTRTLVSSYGVTIGAVALSTLGFVFRWPNFPYEPGIVLVVLWMAVVAYTAYVVLKTPFEIAVQPSGALEFRRPLGRFVIDIREIKSIERSPSGRGCLYIKHQRGKITMHRDIDGLYELIHKLKALNPGITVKGC